MNGFINKMTLQNIYLIYMYKKNLTLNNLQWLVCHKTQPNQTKPNLFSFVFLNNMIFYYIKT